MEIQNASEHLLPVRKTGIQELDELLRGGIPEGSVILLAGKPGTGKTILSMQWLFSGFEKHHDAGLYVAVTEPLTKTLTHFKTMDFYLRNPPEMRKVFFTDIREISKSMDGRHHITKSDIDHMIRTIVKLVRDTGARRIVIDSVTAISYVIKEETLIRYLLFNLSLALRELRCTALMTSEARGENASVFGVEEFMADGIIQMRYTSDKSTALKRYIRILKMRGVNHNSQECEFDITPNGIKIEYSTPGKKTTPKRKRSVAKKSLEEPLRITLDGPKMSENKDKSFLSEMS